LRQGIHLRSYAQKNPKQEYKREAFELFEGLLNTIKSEVTKVTMLVQVKTEADVEAVEKPVEVENVQYQHANYDEALGVSTADEGDAATASQPMVREGIKVGRNDPCPCGSGKKYKQCHGVLS
jgi:preprotein translocase subunit SecA